jgi:putative hydrolases of HD superfamily
MPDTDVDRWLDLLLQANVLKTTPRTGWHLRGVPSPESVADHVFGTGFVALVLMEMDGGPWDREKVLTLALLHDLAESVVSDIPRPADGLLPPGAKAQAEAAALAHMVAGLPLAGHLGELAAEYAAGASLEAKLVHDADRLEFLLQALVYLETTGTRRLEDIRARYHGLTLATPAADRLRRALLDRW